MTTGAEAAQAEDTFPKLLLRNAKKFAGRPAMREKDLGIWQTWNWEDVLDEVRALSVGLSELGIGPGDKVAIVGDNRPRLYWTMAATQALGGVPIPGSSGMRTAESTIREAIERGYRVHFFPEYLAFSPPFK